MSPLVTLRTRCVIYYFKSDAIDESDPPRVDFLPMAESDGRAGRARRNDRHPATLGPPRRRNPQILRGLPRLTSPSARADRSCCAAARAAWWPATLDIAVRGPFVRLGPAAGRVPVALPLLPPSILYQRQPARNRVTNHRRDGHARRVRFHFECRSRRRLHRDAQLFRVARLTAVSSLCRCRHTNTL